MFATPTEAFFYALTQWSGMGLIVFGIAYLGARLGFRHERRTANGR
jgi:hypothetical protein